MWPLMLIRSAPSEAARNGTFRKACTASVCSRALLPASFIARAAAEISVTDPVSLFTSMRETRTVSGRRADRSESMLTEPEGSGLRRVISNPLRSSSSSDFLTASCSASELITCRPFLRMLSVPAITAQLSLSVPQEVNTSSDCPQPRAEAILFLEESSRARAFRPEACVELGFPYVTVMARTAASAASSHTRVVAALSR